MTLYMKIDVRNNELPISIHDSIKEMAEHYGRTRSEITSEMNRAVRRGTRCQWVQVEVEDDEVFISDVG